MLTAYASPALRDRTAHGRAFIAEALRRVAEYRRRADDMTQRVRATRDDYDKLLQMVQRQAQVDEVRLSRLHADLASSQSRSVLVFTVFTVIFLPLTFFTGLFGMNTREWQDENVPTLGFIGVVALPSSFVLVVVSLVAAFSTHARRVLQWVKDVLVDAMRWVYDTLVAPVEENLRQRWYRLGLRGKVKNGKGRGGNGGEKRDARRGVKKEVSDFWARHRPERERGYQIPEVNKKDVAKKKPSGNRGKKDSRGR